MNREELAWAAGFFDGEGGIWAGISSHRTRGTSSRMIHAHVSQKDLRPLKRFQRAVGLGKIYGPYNRKDGSVVVSKWGVYTFEQTQAVVAMLWSFLSEPKREQAKRYLQQYLDLGLTPVSPLASNQAKE